MKRVLISFLKRAGSVVLFGTVCWLSGVKVELRSCLLVAGVLGLVLAAWAARINPQGARVGPYPLPAERITRGPYRFVPHPMYVGQTIGVAFFMWYAAGFWAAMAISILAEILFREYIWRERGGEAPGAAHARTEVVPSAEGGGARGSLG